jgi:hypothetical protein
VWREDLELRIFMGTKIYHTARNKQGESAVASSLTCPSLAIEQMLAERNIARLH